MSRAFCETPLRCGKRRAHGVCPPSKAGPLPPSPPVFTMPEPCPRPTRVRFGRECGFGLMLASEYGAVFVSSAMVNALSVQLSDRLAAQLRDLFGGLERLERVERREGGVDGVVRTERLGEDVVDAGQFEHGAHGAARDDAGTGRGRFQQHV